MANDPSSEEWTELVMIDKIHEIKADVSLHTSNADIGGKFNIDTQGSIKLNTTFAPINSTVNLTATISMAGSADITMHDTFEGRIHIDAAADAHHRVEALPREGPERRGRKRQLAIRSDPSEKVGQRR
ncbi:hypothetical protein WG66_010901 [Moniliophthora roreri]|nr:hypothetical protein WG66_010901 [Moniliophthora roreri]